MSDEVDATARLLSEALDLVVRARALDGMVRREATLRVSSSPDDWVRSGRFDKHVEAHNTESPQSPIETRSLTMPVWAAEQYDKDLFEWEGRARNHLQLVMFNPAKLTPAKPLPTEGEQA